MRRRASASIVTVFLLLVSGCAATDGRGLVPGRSTAAQVKDLMGEPSERIAGAKGDSVWFYARLPEGRRTYAVTIGADGVMRGIEQRLARGFISGIAVNSMTRQQVRALLGPPAHVTRFALKSLEVWEYPWLEFDEKRVVWISFSDDGVVREFREGHDSVSDKPSLAD